MRDGTIVYISSESINYPFPMLYLYGAVKAGMETFLRGVRGELFRDGKNRIVTLRAGSMSGTAFGDGWSESARNEFFQEAMAAGHVAKSGTPMSTTGVADAIVSVLQTPADANIEVIEYRSVDAH
jgi:NADP-dependent 3-hydroxy acid dehydrogenase YdfG